MAAVAGVVVLVAGVGAPVGRGGSAGLAAAGSAEVAPAAPAVEGPGGAVIDALPIVVDDLPSAEDEHARAAFAAATVLRPEPLNDVFFSSWSALTFPPEGEEAVAAVQLALADPAFAVEEFRPLARAAMEHLTGDPSNAERLNNAAIALWLRGIAADADPTDDDAAPAWDIQDQVIALLEATNRAFPDRRAVLLNLAFLDTVTQPAWQGAGRVHAAAALALDPADVTARALLASIRSRSIDGRGLGRGLETIQPLLDDADTAWLGHALAGDAYLTAAAIRRAEAPEEARLNATRALAAYDHALALVDDAGLHAGRAKALEARGELDAAVAAQARAVDLMPDALNARIELARLRHLAGDVEGLQVAAEQAMALAREGWDPAIDGLRLTTTVGDQPLLGDRGFLGWSVGSGEDHLPVRQVPLGSGGGLVSVGLVPRVEAPTLDQELATEVGPRVAWRLAFDAAVIDGDVDRAEALAAGWDDAIPWFADWEPWLEAARLVADPKPVTPGSEAALAIIEPRFVAQTALRRAGRFGEAAAFCRALGDLRCAGNSAFHAGDPAQALRDLEAAYAASEASDFGPDAELRLGAGAAAEAAGDLARAEEAFLLAAGDTRGGARSVVRAALRLGDLRLGDGDPGAAIAWYDLAVATIQANNLTETGSGVEQALEARGLLQVARNNRAVARLRSLQPDSDTPPDCSPASSRARCEAALADVRAAVASDPGRGAYRMTEGWAARLLGDDDGARAALAAAVELDPSLHPAFNDLGVLLAQQGDVRGARQAFEAAASADPSYDLARWNLGILELRDVPGGLLEGQRLLAEAIRHDPSLRTQPLAFRTDERTYRFGFEAALPAPASTSLGRTFSVGAVVLAAASSVAALAQLQATVTGHAVGTAADTTRDWLDRQGRRTGWRGRQRRLRRAIPRPIGREWLPWAFAILVLGAITAWQAAQGSPETAAAAVLLTLGATVAAIVAHALGHLVALRALRGRLLPATWGPGAIVALAFLPFQAASGPFPAERIRLRRGGTSGVWAFHLAGPAGNALLGVIAYLLFLVEPVPALRLLSQVQLAAIGYALLPTRPLDGWALERDRPRLLVALGFGVVAGGAAFALGLL